jgi:hypothetical protein
MSVIPSGDVATGCACGETFLIGDDRIAHFIDVFVPEGDTGRDGERHLETEGGGSPLRCECGAVFGDADALDAHFENVFMPPDHRGADGRVHTGTTLLPPALPGVVVVIALPVSGDLAMRCEGGSGRSASRAVRSTHARDPRVARGMRRVRIERGWSLDEVAGLLKCHPSRISRIENGLCGTPAPAITAELLGVPLGYLLMSCPRCADRPPRGYQCLRCGTHAAVPGREAE